MMKIRQKLDDILYDIKEYKVEILIGFVTVIAVIVGIICCLALPKRTETVNFCEECGGKMVYTDSVKNTSFLPMSMGGRTNFFFYTDVEYVYTCEDCGKTITTDVKPE